MSRWMKKPFLSLYTRAKDIPTSARSDSLSTTTAGTAKDRHYIAKSQQSFNGNRYEAVKELGKRSYSRVWLAKDLWQDSYVVLKILSNDCYGSDYDIFEIEISEAITREQKHHSEPSSTHVLSARDTFQLGGPNGTHHCIALPVLGCDLGVQARRFAQGRIPVRIMKHITRQLLIGRAFLHEKCKVIHTTIAGGQTAEQVTPISVEDAPGSVRIIDFGVASWIDKHLSDNIQPEHLRAPEVIIGAPWGTAVDIWSLGCLVIEFVKGHVAFPGAAKEGSWTSSDDHLAQYMEVLGPMPSELLDRGTKAHEFFDKEGVLRRIPDLKSTTLRDFVDGQQAPFQRPQDISSEDALVFVDFLQGALALDPRHRKTATELLQHKWLQ